MRFSLQLLLVLFCLTSYARAFVLPTWFSLDYVRQTEWSPFKTDMIKDCSDDSFILDIYDITVTPPHPVPGDEVLIEATGYLKERVEKGAVAHVLVRIGVVQILRKTFDICDELENNDVELKCPIEEGLLKVTQKVTIPKEVPRARLTVFVRAENYDDADLACLNVNVDFRPHHRFFDVTLDA